MNKPINSTQDRCIAVRDAFSKFYKHFPPLPDEHNLLREVMACHGYVMATLSYIIGDADQNQRDLIEDILDAANDPEAYVQQFVEETYGHGA